MANNMLKIAVILGAVDNMSQVISGAVSKSTAKLNELAERTQRLAKGTALITAGIGIAEALKAPITAYGELEKAQLSLESVMLREGNRMDRTLVGKMHDEAIKLGNLLPGTTADMEGMFVTLIQNGAKAQDVTNGLGKAAAFFATNMGLSYNEGAEMAARLSNNLKISGDKMYEFMDVIARTRQLGANPLEITYAFSKASGAINLLGMNDMQSAKELGAVYAQLITKAGFTGETAGTAFQNVLFEMMNADKLGAMTSAAHNYGIKDFAFFDAQGQFGGIANMIAQLDKLKGLTALQQMDILKNVAGPEGKDLSLLIALTKQGAAGFNDMTRAMSEQATLMDKVNLTLTGQDAMWEATTGTITNTAAALGQALSPELKKAALAIAKVSEQVQGFLKQNPMIAKMIGLMAGLAAVTLMVAGAVTILSAAAFVNPLTWMAVGAIAGVVAFGLLIAKWDELHAKLRETSPAMQFAVEVVKNMAGYLYQVAGIIRFLIDNWEAISEKITAVSDTVQKTMSMVPDWAKNFPGDMVVPGGSALNNLFKTPSAITPPVESNIVKNGGVSNQSKQTNITYSPSITIPGGTTMQPQDMKEMLKEHAGDILRIFKGAADNNARLSF